MAIAEATRDTFEKLTTESAFAIIDFWAPWCGPCRAFAPVFEKASEEYLDVTFIKVNTETETELAAHFEIRSIPTLMIMRDQVIIYAEPGSLPASGLKDLIDKARALDMTEVHREIAANAPNVANTQKS
ncbi:MAG: thioredoxin [Acidiferrobacteraceae bacterium]